MLIRVNGFCYDVTIKLYQHHLIKRVMHAVVVVTLLFYLLAKRSSAALPCKQFVRFQRVKCGTVFSDWKPVKGGIPQGSALGPLLFLIYVNNMPKQVQHGPLLQFADDTCLICCGSSSESVSKLLSEDLSLLSSWTAQSRMQVNVGKSYIMWFKISRPKSGVSLPPVYLNDSPLSCVVHHKYMGVHFDPQLSWDTHISNVCKRMSYYLYLMSYHHRVLPSCILKLLANSLVISQLTYALPVWGPSLKVNLC